MNKKIGEVPPPSPGFTAVTLTLPEVVIRDAGTQAINWPLLMNEVESDVAFHTTKEVGTKFTPFTINSKAGPPAVAAGGEMELIVGSELFSPVMVKSTAGEEAPEVGITATLEKPADAIRAPLIWVVSFEALTNVVT